MSALASIVFANSSVLLKFFAFFCEEPINQDEDLKDIYDSIKASDYRLSIVEDNILEVVCGHNRWLIPTLYDSNDIRFSVIWENLRKEMAENNRQFMLLV
jgi:hypothetical protein